MRYLIFGNRVNVAAQLEGFLNQHDDAIAFGQKATEPAPSHSLARASLAMSENYAGHPKGVIPLPQRQFG